MTEDDDFGLDVDKRQKRIEVKTKAFGLKSTLQKRRTSLMKGKTNENYRFHSQTPEYKSSMKDAIRKQLKMPISVKPKKQQLYYLYKMIMNRRTFEYKMRHTLRYYCKCFCLRSNKSLK